MKRDCPTQAISFFVCSDLTLTSQLSALRLGSETKEDCKMIKIELMICSAVGFNRRILALQRTRLYFSPIETTRHPSIVELSPRWGFSKLTPLGVQY